MRSVPIHLVEDYEIEFEQDDVIACEDELKMGYIFFFRVEKVDGKSIPVMLSLKLLRPLIHHGLKTRNAKGEFEYVFPQTPAGAQQAGELIRKFKQNGGSDIVIWEKCYEALKDWFGEPDPNEHTNPDSGADTKNLPPAGKKQRNR